MSRAFRIFAFGIVVSGAALHAAPGGISPGCYQCDGESGPKVRIEEGRWVIASGSEPGDLRVYGVVRTEPGKVVVRSHGSVQTWEVATKDGTLLLKLGGGSHACRKMEGVPEALQAAPLPLPAASEVPEAKRALVQAELKKREDADQAARRALGGSDDAKKIEEVRAVDRDDTAWLRKTIAEIGWIDASRFGAKAADSAFLLVQHSSDLRLMLAALPLIEKDVSAGLLDGEPYALLYDRLRMNMGGMQRYGTQLNQDKSGNLAVLSLEDPAHVDERRKSLGMPPIADYLRMFNNGGKPIRVAEEDE